MDLVIHVGLHKTGTTTLQESLEHNYTQLLERNILYPKTGLFISQHALILGTFFPSHHVLDSADRSNDPNHYLDLFEKEVNQHNPILTILSSEVFTEISWDREGCLGLIDSLSRQFSDTKILLTTRKPEQQALSSVCHIIRNNMPGHRENPVNLYFNMLACFRNWGDFWLDSGLPIIEKKLEDSHGKLVEHYIGDIISQYSFRAKDELIKSVNSQNNNNARLNADPHNPLVYLVAFVLGNSQISPTFFRNASFCNISRECNSLLGTELQKSTVTAAILLNYLNYFSPENLPKLQESNDLLSLESKRDAMKNAGLSSDSITSIIAITKHLIQKHAHSD